MGAKQSSVVPTDTRYDPTDEFYYLIVSNDNREFKVGELALQQSETLKTLVESMEHPKEEFKTHPIPIENCDRATLELVFKWCEHHKGEPVPEDDGSVPKKVFVSDFDMKLTNINLDALIKLINAAHYLNIQQLMSVCCKRVAMMATGKSPDQLQHIFGFLFDEPAEI